MSRPDFLDPLATQVDPLAKPDEPLAKTDEPLATPDEPPAKPDDPLATQDDPPAQPHDTPPDPLATPHEPLATPAEPERIGGLGLYLPDAGAEGPSPAVLFVHGGSGTPLPGYASLVAARGVVGVTVDHDLDGPDAYSRADARLRAAIGRVRDDHRVDGDRIALWFFAGSGLLSAGWLRDPPDWLRCVALTNPLLDALPGHHVEPFFRPIAAVDDVGAAAWAGVAGAMRANALPIVLTRLDPERPEVAATVEAFTAAAEAAQASLTIVDGRTHVARPAITTAIDHVLSALRRPAYP